MKYMAMKNAWVDLLHAGVFEWNCQPLLISSRIRVMSWTRRKGVMR